MAQKAVKIKNEDVEVDFDLKIKLNTPNRKNDQEKSKPQQSKDDENAKEKPKGSPAKPKITEKYKTFVKKPLGEKGVKNVVPGINEEGAKELSKLGIKTADDLLTKFILLKKDTEKFEDWLKKLGINESNRKMCSDSFKDWCDMHIYGKNLKHIQTN